VLVPHASIAFVFLCSSNTRAETDFAVALSLVTSVQQSDLDEMDRALATTGHERIGNRDLLLGMGVLGSWSRMRFGWEVSTGFTREVRHTDTGWTGNVIQFQSFVDAGYDVYRGAGWSLAGHGGIGLARLSLDATSAHPPFGGGWGTRDDTSLAQTSGLVRAAMGVTWYPELMTPRRTSDRLEISGPLLLVDLRLGYQQAFAVGGWTEVQGGTDLGSSPRVDLSGPYVMLNIGFGGGDLGFGAAAEDCGAAPPHSTWKARGMSCMPACMEGYGDCDDDPGNGCEADFDTNAGHCGKCGAACDLPHARAACRSGRCVPDECDAGWGDCDGRPVSGCETDLGASTTHCGACGNRCRAGQECRSGVCRDVPPVEIAR